MDDQLMSREEVATHLGIPADQVRKAMSRAGIPHVSGWPRDEVEKLERPGKGWRAGQRSTTTPADEETAVVEPTEHTPNPEEET